MNTEDRKAFLEIVIGFAELKGKTLSAPALELYWHAMQPWPLSDFRIAASQLLRTLKFMPTPADFEDLRKANRITPGEAFASIRVWLVYSPNGYTLSETTPRNIASAIQAMGGVNAYAMAREDQLPFLEKRFCEHYEQITANAETREEVSQLLFDSAERLPMQQAGLKRLSR